ncbi:MAG TPA: hypothetical protein DDY91_07525 [Planctomycetaceae bacterium]|nr:hypothetical protein [Planctomycetaceae bacterium]
MARHFMAYWKSNQPALQDPRGRLIHAASNYYRRVEVGDTVWIVTLIDQELHLVGKIPVHHVVDHETAEELLNEFDLWCADWHIIGDLKKKGSPIRFIRIHDRAEDIEFQTDKGPSGGIQIINGRISGTALQTMRQLTPDSAALFEEKLAAEESWRKWK